MQESLAKDKLSGLLQKLTAVKSLKHFYLGRVYYNITAVIIAFP
jgi:hypothetical protein